MPINLRVKQARADGVIGEQLYGQGGYKVARGVAGGPLVFILVGFEELVDEEGLVGFWVGGLPLVAALEKIMVEGQGGG